MNILYLGSFRLPNYDAAAPRVLNNARAMQLCGHQVSFISWGGKYRESDLCDDGRYRIDGMEYIISDELDPNGSLLSKMLHLIHRGEKTLNYLEKMEVKPDLIVMYNADYRLTKCMLNFCKKYEIKLANDITEWYENNELHFWNIIPYYYNMTCLQRNVRNKICISSYLNEYYKESNNILLPPLCDKTEKKWKESIVDERIKLYDGITLIYAGNPAKKDCVHSVVKVVNKLANDGLTIRFMILGTTRESYIKKYSNLLGLIDLHENIIFLGRVSQDLIPAYYKKADFMVLLREPTRKNMAGFPTKFVESMTAGIPVIANVTSDLGGYIINGHTGFIVKDEKVESLETTLRKVAVLSHEQVNEMKKETVKANDVFNYKSRTDEMQKFLSSLK